MEHTTFWDHMIQSALPTVKVCMLGAVGVVLARSGVLDQHGRRALSRLIYFVFTPCLTFSKLAPVLSAQHLLLWMPLAINMFVSVAVGLLLGVLLVLLVRPPTGFSRHVIVTTGLGNAGNLPLVLVSALLRSSGGILFAGQDVSVDLAIAYVAMGIWAATITHFTVGTQLLKLPNSSSTAATQGHSSAKSSSSDHSSRKAGSPREEQLPLVMGGLPQRDDSKQRQAVELSTSSGPFITSQGLASCNSCSQIRDESFGNSMQCMPDGSTCNSCGAPGAVHNCMHCNVQQCSRCGGEQPEWSGPAAHAKQQNRGHHRHQHQQQLNLREDSAAVINVHAIAATKQSLGLHHPAVCQHCKLKQAEPHCQQHDTAEKETDSLLGPALQRNVSSSDSAAWVQVELQQRKQQHAKQHLTNTPDHPMMSHRQQQCSWFGQLTNSTGSRRISKWCVAATAAAGSTLWAVASPPMVGCMVAVVVGVLPAVRNQLFTAGGHLLMLQDCIGMFGDCCIPCLMLMLGATLAKGPGHCCPPVRIVVGVTAARLLVLPLLGVGWMLLASKAGWLVAPDRMFLLVMLIQNSVPTALNVHTLATLNNNREEEVGALLFWQYLAACVTVPACLMLFTWLLKSGALAVVA